MSDYSIVIQAWRNNNPNGSKSECARFLNFSRTTVHKYWADDDIPAKEKRILSYIDSHENATIKGCARDLSLARNTVRKYWRNIMLEKTKKEVVKPIEIAEVVEKTVFSTDGTDPDQLLLF